jgi:site-specific DNA-methyltransferase (cytosine-N4-specific)
VLDSFSGSATTGLVAFDHGRDYVGLDLNAEYLELGRARLLGERPPKPGDGDDDRGILEFFG